MFLTGLLFAKKAKSKHVLMTVESLVSGHKINRIRERLADKLEFMFFDPYVQQEVMYREKKKLCNIYRLKDKSKPYPVRKKHYWES
ncbi:39S ribosomal protein L33, mitochondrial [Microplitis demolitor]|uniref:39S ribosomal protein L33, mitochondrial n=1 Tax=Microplitis demolitor TaxID=69319 RepID=UPI0004CDB170|nr:39S ribosomal protein L33, mitochondrial [Microplitis demolitor]